jgi:hypothetical protein
MKVVSHPEAYEEMFESACFYETRSEGLGADFLDAVDEVARSIQQFPKLVASRDSMSAGGLFLVSHSAFSTRSRVSGFSSLR